MPNPIIAVTMGDPAGIGPELVVKVLSEPAAHAQCRPFAIGDPRILAETARALGSGLRFRTIAGLAEAAFAPGCIDVLPPAGVAIEHVPVGQVDPAMGRAAVRCLETAYELAGRGEIQAVVAAPLNKQAMKLAGYAYYDDLEYLAAWLNCPDAYALAVAEGVWTTPVTLHVPFKDIVAQLTPERIVRYTRNTDGVLRVLGYAAPRIAVAALNVHGGEGGLCGREEIEIIAPAVAEARRLGIDAQGPYAADTVYVRAAQGEFDAVVAMYHDQANIARKLLATWKGATLYMGLPVVCATTAHGTALDRAGQGTSDPGSLRDCLRYAVTLAARP